MSAPTRIWFNRNVSGTYQLAHLLRSNPDAMPVEILGTYSRADHVMLQACDYADLEPVIADHDDYVAWALDYARRHRVDVMVPGEAHQEALAAAAARFADQGTLVQSSTAPVIAAMADKAEAYRRAAALGVPVPQFEVVIDAEGLRGAYDRLLAAGHDATMKPVEGAGAQGFWRLTQDRPDLAGLLSNPGPTLNIDTACGILAQARENGEVIPPLLVSQYMAGPEDSVDVLADGTSMLAAIVRRKPSVGQTRSFPHDPEVLELTERLVTAFGLEYLCNVQWRRVDGAPMLLEVNTRAASGLFQSCSSGINFPYLALRLQLGLPFDVPVPRPSPDQVVFSDTVAMHRITPPIARPPVTAAIPAQTQGRRAVSLPDAATT